MIRWILGLAAFVLFFLYDWNRVYWKKRWMKGFFLAGNLLLAFVALGLIREGLAAGGYALCWLGAGACFLAGLIYTLYFALPFDSTYCREADGHPVCRSGLYGLCRHPGIWWFLGMFVCLGMAAGGGRMSLCLCLSFSNLLYAWYQDRFIFVKEFSDYEDYRRKVPFLVPRIVKGGDDR